MWLVYLMLIASPLGSVDPPALFPAESGEWQHDSETSLEGPLWWTLDPQLSPKRLQHSWNDIDTRNLNGVSLKWIPWWMAWIELTEHATLDRSALREGLATHAVSPEGIETILANAERTVESRRALRDQLATETRDLLALLRSAKEVLGPKRMSRAWDEQRIAEIAEAAGVTEVRLRTLVLAGRRDARVESATPEAMALREQLSAQDWTALTTYLRLHVAPSIIFGTLDNPEQEPIDGRLGWVVGLIGILAFSIGWRRWAGYASLIITVD